MYGIKFFKVLFIKKKEVNLQALTQLCIIPCQESFVLLFTGYSSVSGSFTLGRFLDFISLRVCSIDRKSFLLELGTVESKDNR